MAGVSATTLHCKSCGKWLARLTNSGEVAEVNRGVLYTNLKREIQGRRLMRRRGRPGPPNIRPDMIECRCDVKGNYLSSTSGWRWVPFGDWERLVERVRLHRDAGLL